MTKLMILVSLLMSASAFAKIESTRDFSFGSDRVSIHAVEIPNEEMFVTIELNRKLFLTAIRFGGEEGLDLFVDGYDAKMSKSDKAILQKTLRRFRPSKKFSRMGKLIVRSAVYFLLFTPEGYKHKRYEGRSKENYKGQCIYDGETHTAYFTDWKQNVLTSTKTINIKESEVGVCGSGPITTGWTRDCLTHDECQNTMGRLDRFELPGGLGPNCFDEFIRAIDDFFFSKWFWGCRGKR